MSYFYFNGEQCVYHYQNILILKDIHKSFGAINFGGKKTIVTDNFFIVTNIRIYQQMDAE